MKLSTALVACLAALSWTPAQIEAFGRTSFAGSTFRHSVNNLRPEVHRTNSNAFRGAMRSTFKSPADIPTNKLSAYGTAVQFGGNLHKHGYGSQGMGNWDEMDDEEVGWGDDFGRPAHTRPQQPTGESIMNSIMWDHTDDEEVGWGDDFGRVEGVEWDHTDDTGVMRRLFMKSHGNCQRCRAYNGYSSACNKFC